MKNMPKFLRPLLALLLISVLASAYYLLADSDNKAVFYGTVKGETYVISTQVGGTVTRVSHQEGDRVKADDPLVSIDDGEVQMRLDKAQLMVQIANSQMDKTQNPARVEERAIQANTIEQLKVQAGLLALQKSKLELALLQTKNQLKTAIDLATLKADSYKTALTLRQNGSGTQSHVDQSHLDWQGALTSQRNLELQIKIQEAEVKAIEDQILSAKLSVDSALERLKQLDAGADPQDQSLAGLNVRLIEKDLALLMDQVSHYHIKAPRAGLIEGLYYKAGEWVAPGAHLATLVDLDQVSVTLYVPESMLPTLAIGDRVSLRATTTGTPATGKIKTIASKAMFTPMNVVTSKDRQRLVFPVEVEIEAPPKGIVPGIQLEASFTLNDLEQKQ